MPTKTVSKKQVPILNLEEVYKIYRSEKTETTALRGVSLSIYEGEKVALIGPSGAGKTTLVNIAAGLLPPTSGRVFWSGISRDISRLSREQIIRERRHFAGLVFQETKLIPHLNVYQNVTLGGHLAGMAPREIDTRAKMLLDLVGLSNRLKYKPNMLSGGERQRVALAAALITNPKLIIADEVTASLDPLTGEKILDVLDTINKKLTVALLIATHSQQVASRAERIIEIKDGVILATHGKTVRLRHLELTRQLAVDPQHRVSLPEDMLQELGNPKSLKAKLIGKEIILSLPREEYYEAVQVKTCSVCGAKIETAQRVCKNCGTVVN
ncbi:MAG: ATP-binding cassette domain-containing protein [Candidatus Heimdallarchaeota archaeon]|nr:ATP-binding cassette domain-containing protein [Candidatus Heimdallarchaeota archaeon]